MRNFTLLTACALLLAGIGTVRADDVRTDDVETLEIGANAPPFSLMGVDDRTYTLDDFADADVLVVIFTCNHCPTAQAYEERLMRFHEDYKDRGVALVAISPNDPDAIRLDELGYTDISDSFEEMKMRAEEMGFAFPYLYDGDDQEASKAYGPMATPHVFVFDAERTLRYVGRIDDNEKEELVTSRDTRNAVDALLAGEPVPVETTRTFGCSIKWDDKSGSVERARERWAAEEVTVSMMNRDQAVEMMANDTENLRVINFWATWCGPCIVEFPSLVDINRMYRGRKFEFVTVSMDAPDQHEAVKTFLERQEASMTNYHFDSEDQYALIEAVDEEWPGALPYTVLVAPGGEVIYRQLGEIDPLELKKAIVGYVGRYYE